MRLDQLLARQGRGREGQVADHEGCYADHDQHHLRQFAEAEDDGVRPDRPAHQVVPGAALQRIIPGIAAQRIGTTAWSSFRAALR